MSLRKFFSKTSLVLGSVAFLASSIVSAQSMIRNCKPGYVAVTYDDGPNVYTEDLVEFLNSNGIKATFFVNGDNFLSLKKSQKGRTALKKAFDSGHQIASHTWSHKDLTSVDDSEFDREIVELEKIVSEITGGFRPAFIRPPYGSANKDTIKKLTDRGYKVAGWSTDTKDYVSHDLTQEMKNVKESFTRANLDNGYIILSHDVYEQTTTSLTRELIKYVKEQGFKFCTVAECVGSSPYK